jgi:hypothetical protein
MDTIRAFFQKYANVLATISTLLSGLTIWLGQQGCLSTGDLAATCSIPWLPASWMPAITIAFIAASLIARAVRPGGFLRGLLGETAVVSPTSAVGTVTPAQVASK